jgi:hypothetical protein
MAATQADLRAAFFTNQQAKIPLPRWTTPRTPCGSTGRAAAGHHPTTGSTRRTWTGAPRASACAEKAKAECSAPCVWDPEIDKCVDAILGDAEAAGPAAGAVMVAASGTRFPLPDEIMVAILTPFTLQEIAQFARMNRWSRALVDKHASWTISCPEPHPRHRLPLTDLVRREIAGVTPGAVNSVFRMKVRP